ncbi:MAG: phosphoglycerate kinase [Patescibacteria group bacterium]
MKLRLADSVDVSGKRVILRVALDVHYHDEDGRLAIDDDARIKAIIPSIKDLQARGAKVILMSWLQRPGGKVVPEMSLAPVSSRLTELLGQPVHFFEDCIGDEVAAYIEKVPQKSVILLENVRFHTGEAGESGMDLEYAKALAKNGDIFINDAFAQIHRDVASITGIPQFLPSYAGPLLNKEIRALSQITDNPPRPLIAIIGGAKISTKLNLITSLMKKVDYLLLGGALANTILKAQGVQVGKSLIEEKMMQAAQSLSLTDTRLKIPVDVVTASEIKESVPIEKKAVGSVAADQIILDIGPDTVELYKMIIKQAKTLVWNGPMGYFEIEQFATGTYDIAKAIAGQTDLQSVVGGGETVDAIHTLGLEDKFSFVSTGGGAMLEFLEKGTLAGLEPLIEK